MAPSASLFIPIWTRTGVIGSISSPNLFLDFLIVLACKFLYDSALIFRPLWVVMSIERLPEKSLLVLLIDGLSGSSISVCVL